MMSGIFVPVPSPDLGQQHCSKPRPRPAALFQAQISASSTCRGIFCVPLIKLRGGCCLVDTGGIIDHHHLKFLF